MYMISALVNGRASSTQLGSLSMVDLGTSLASSCTKVFRYVLFLRFSSEGDEASVWRLLRYNRTVESWENVDDCIYSFITSSLVSYDCLSPVLWYKEKSSDYDMSEECFLEVQEIRTRDMTQEAVLKLSAADMMATFDIKTGSPFGKSSFIRRFNLLGISVIGFEISLFFMPQASGKSKLFNLVTRSWGHGLPSNPLGQMHETDIYTGVHGLGSI